MTDWSPRILSILRIVAALLFVEHGLMKLFGFPSAQSGVPDPLPTVLVIAALIEIVGGTLLMFGLFTRFTAFIASGEMAVAYFMGHLPSGFWPGVNGGGEAILFCFIFLYLATSGGGPCSIDAIRRELTGGLKLDVDDTGSLTISPSDSMLSSIAVPRFRS